MLIEVEHKFEDEEYADNFNSNREMFNNSSDKYSNTKKIIYDKSSFQKIHKKGLLKYKNIHKTLTEKFVSKFTDKLQQ